MKCTIHIENNICNISHRHKLQEYLQIPVPVPACTISGNLCYPRLWFEHWVQSGWGGQINKCHLSSTAPELLGRVRGAVPTIDYGQFRRDLYQSVCEILHYCCASIPSIITLIHVGSSNSCLSLKLMKTPAALNVDAEMICDKYSINQCHFCRRSSKLVLSALPALSPAVTFAVSGNITTACLGKPLLVHCPRLQG